ncbi:MAG: carbohydrate kinase family protein [Rhodoblastus sp.]
MRKIYAMGEAVVDVLPADGGLWRPVPGGSSYNVALALGRLGAPSAFVGRLSRDEQGEIMLRALAEAGVATDLVARDDRPSPLSLVERGSQAQSPRYRIHLADTAHAPPDPPAGWLAGAAHLHVSSFSAFAGPWGEAVAAALVAAKGAATRSLDVNIRPNLLPSRDKTLELLDARLAHVEIVKASDEDLAWLFPGENPDETAARWSMDGLLVVLTRAAAGASVFGAGEPVHGAGLPVSVVDSVGAGDAFVAAFLTRALETGALETGALGETGRTTRERMAAILAFANMAGALSCTRAGADAPTRAEIEARLGGA